MTDEPPSKGIATGLGIPIARAERLVEMAGDKRRWPKLIDRYPFNSPWVTTKARTFGEDWFLPIWFFILSFRLLSSYATDAPNSFGFDVKLYRIAAESWLQGLNPWLPTLPFDRVHTAIGYAGPPPTLLPFMLVAWIPQGPLVIAFALLSCAVAVWTLRRLGLPLWWILFPPVAQGIWVGNLNILVMGSLVAGGTLAGAGAVVFKVYAVVPLALLGRWRPLLAAAVIILVTFPFLPWSTFLAEYPRISAALADQAWGGETNLLTSPVALAGGVLALGLLPRERAAWLAVPVVWPATQLHYTSLAIPGMTPLIAVFGAINTPGYLGLGVMVYAIWTRRDLIWSILGHRGGD